MRATRCSSGGLTVNGTAMSPLASARRSAPLIRRRVITASVLIALGVVPVVAFAAPDPAPSPDPSPSPGPSPSPSPTPDPSPTPEVTEFSAAFLSGTSADLSRFERGNPILPGVQQVDLYVNEQRISRQTVTFEEQGDRIKACLNLELLLAAGVDTAKLEAEGHDLSGDCLDLESLIAGARVRADAGDMSLNLSVPQLYIQQRARGYVDPRLWDRGVTAFTLGYSFNANNTDSDVGGNTRSAFLGLNAGLNVAGWRIRNQSYYNWNKDRRADFTNISTYAQHDVDRLKSQFTIGDTFTPGQMFDSIGYRGVSLASDDRMLPDSQNGYAPIVRGVADTNATVVIRQNGYVIYQMNVAPGPFEIQDLPAAGYGGDLGVVGTEAAGRQRSLNVPFAAVPNLLRPGASRYSVVAGEVRNDSLTFAPKFVEGTYQRGINNWLTGYGGVQATDGNLYRGALLGAGFNTPIGAMSLDVSGSKVQFSGGRGSQSGYSARAAYNKNIPSTKTNFALAAYRYSSQGYADLDEAARWDDLIRSREMHGLLRDSGVERNRLSLSMAQDLGQAGQLNLSASRHDYWSGRPVDTSYQLGWTRRYGSATVGLNVGRTRAMDRGYDTAYALSVTLPLGSDRSRHVPVLSLAGSHDVQGNAVQANVSATSGDRNQFYYGANGNFNDRNTDSVGTYGGWRGAYGNVSGAYTQGTGVRTGSVSAQGGVVVHPGGITLAPSINEQMAIVEAKGAKGAHLADGISKIDRRGYAVSSSLMPYRINTVSLDPKGASYDVELKEAAQQVVPRAGAIIPVKFETNQGAAYVIQARLADGGFAPFGSEVRTSTGAIVGYVGQGGQALVGVPDAPRLELSVDLGEGRCTLDWQPATAVSNAAGLKVASATCRAH